MRITKAQAKLLKAISEGGFTYTLGWRSAPGRPALSRGTYAPNGAKVSKAQYDALRLAGLVKHDLDSPTPDGWNVIATAAGRAVL